MEYGIQNTYFIAEVVAITQSFNTPINDLTYMYNELRSSNMSIGHVS